MRKSRCSTRPTGPRILILRPNGSKATELLEAAHDVASGGEKEEITDPANQTGTPTYRATAFGNEVDSPPEKVEKERSRLMTLITSGNRESTLALARDALPVGLGDTRRPINDVTLWDLSHSVAAFYKAALSKVILDRYWIPSPHGQIQWRLLHVSFDGPAFWGQAHHVTDMLGRRRAVGEGLDAVQDLLEVQPSGQRGLPRRVRQCVGGT